MTAKPLKASSLRPTRPALCSRKPGSRGICLGSPAGSSASSHKPGRLHSSCRTRGFAENCKESRLRVACSGAALPPLRTCLLLGKAPRLQFNFQFAEGATPTPALITASQPSPWRPWDLQPPLHSFSGAAERLDGISCKVINGQQAERPRLVDRPSGTRPRLLVREAKCPCFP